MRVLMLGWEFPPYIAGGLGTACYGLTKGLSRQGVQVLFVLPRPVPTEDAGHLRLISPLPQPPRPAAGPWPDPVRPSVAAAGPEPAALPEGIQPQDREAFGNVRFRTVPMPVRNPYLSTGGQVRPGAADGVGLEGPVGQAVLGDQTVEALAPVSVLRGGSEGPVMVNARDNTYGEDLMGQTRRYAEFCLRMTRREAFDVIHAHDWLTFPAGLRLAAATGRPLVVHVHSTEFDRAGDNIQREVYEIERRGMHGAARVIAVSHLTRTLLIHRYGVDPEKIDVVYNGIDSGNGADASYQSRATIRKGDKIVLFLGRITMQKGPEYFVAAARKVLEKIDNVKFVMAGSGDKVRDIIELAAAEGIGHKVLFTGFLRGKDVERVFRMASVYVMPSVSEPFGITPLEAIRHDVPVIISKTSGVSEVLTHALKVDFWDTHEIANKIIAVLRHPPLSTTLRENADLEVRRLSWDDAAEKCQRVYHDAIKVVPV